jgi:O-succinylbenzoic acid--CoA ligase
MERGDLAARLDAAVSGVSREASIIEESEPSRFAGSFASAVGRGGNVFLANPGWRDAERRETARLSALGAPDDRGWLMVPSGGAGGGLKFARHDGFTLAAAVEGFRTHFGLDRVNTLSVLPLHHVSGLMAWMRSALSGGTFMPASWKEIESGRFPASLPADCCLSLVPTQLQRLAASGPAVAWLRRFRVVFVGGGPAWEGLLDEAARLGIPLSPSYGSTETAAMVAALKPEQFLGGVRGCGSALPHAAIDLEDGVVRVRGESVFRGYFPEMSGDRAWVSGDVGSIGPHGSLFIEGRVDDVIITGGKKVFPSEVEAALRSTGGFEDVAVIGVPDAEWGQRVVACHPSGRVPPPQDLAAALGSLASFKHPKRYAAVSAWPRNSQGKIDRRELARLAGQA